MNLTLIILIYSIIAFYEALPLIRERDIRELMAATAVWLLGFVISILLTFDVSLPSPILLMSLFSDLALGLLHRIF